MMSGVVLARRERLNLADLPSRMKKRAAILRKPPPCSSKKACRSMPSSVSRCCSVPFIGLVTLRISRMFFAISGSICRRRSAN